MIISGKELAKQTREMLSSSVAQYAAQYGRTPHLAVIIAGDDEGSKSYVRAKARASAETGIRNTTIELPATVSQQELCDLVQRLNADDDVDGILVQLPLPEHIDSCAVISSVALEKDVDGFHPLNVAALWQKRPCTPPCTPRGIIRLLDAAGVEIEGKRAVVVGRSNIVGMPMSKMLLDRNATVTTAHSRTKDLGAITSEAEILVVAAGSPHLIKADMVRDGAVVIDVGVNRTPDGHLCGDVDFDAVAAKASVITPVPGGVGPMTICSLMENTVECYLKRMNNVAGK